MYCVIKCVKTKRVLKRKFASSVFHNCNAKTQICVTGHQSVKRGTGEWDSFVPLHADPLLLKGKTLSCSGHLNWTVLQPTLEMWHLKDCMITIKVN
jgi:hypothetical protein